MTKFVNMDYDASTNQWWIDAIPNYPTDTARVSTFYEESYVYYKY